MENQMIVYKATIWFQIDIFKLEQKKLPKNEKFVWLVTDVYYGFMQLKNKKKYFIGKK